jgi:hypothetical protein
MCTADALSEIDAQRAALVAELMAEMTALRAKANDIADEIHRQAMEDPAAAGAEASLRFQRMVTAITRIGGFQLLLLEKEGTLSREAVEAGERRAASAQRRSRKLGGERKMQCAYLFDEHALQPAEGEGGFDAEDIRKDLFAWVLDAEYPERFATMGVGDIMIDITRHLKLQPDATDQTAEQWETAVRERWAPLDDLVEGFDPHRGQGPPFVPMAAASAAGP